MKFLKKIKIYATDVSLEFLNYFHKLHFSGDFANFIYYKSNICLKFHNLKKKSKEFLTDLEGYNFL